MTAIERDMAVTVADFLRALDDAAAASFRAIGCAGTATIERPAEKQESAQAVTLLYNGRRVEIGLTPREPRKLGAMSLPLTRLRMAFSGFSEDETRLFLSCFDSYYRRGGG
jgi:hypothetical protein